MKFYDVVDAMKEVFQDIRKKKNTIKFKKERKDKNTKRKLKVVLSKKYF